MAAASESGGLPQGGALRTAGCQFGRDAGVPHPRASTARAQLEGKARVDGSPGKGTRQDLLRTLAGGEAGSGDCWIGNPLVDPSKGKRAVQPPRDPRGRTGLFETLNSTRPGMLGYLDRGSKPHKTCTPTTYILHPHSVTCHLQMEWNRMGMRCTLFPGN